MHFRCFFFLGFCSKKCTFIVVSGNFSFDELFVVFRRLTFFVEKDKIAIKQPTLANQMVHVQQAKLQKSDLLNQNGSIKNIMNDIFSQNSHKNDPIINLILSISPIKFSQMIGLLSGNYLLFTTLVNHKYQVVHHLGTLDKA